MMFKYIAFLFLFIAFSVNAAERLSCDQLDDLATSIDELGTAFVNAQEIEVGGELDNALADVINALYDVADVEQEATLDAYIGDLEVAWKNMDAQNFSQALDDVVGSLDRLLRRDC